ncbi:MAG: 3'(2'),5'-bisphosphate nucleotidase CysQ [Pseudomonadota bacterium]
MSSLLQDVVFIAKQAGKQILNHYHQNDFKVEYKPDNSPITAADIAAHEFICQALSRLTPKIPILSEELKTASFGERQCWQRYWLIDPLDGTKEFLEKNGEFTVNIALIEKNIPMLGVVYAPAFDFCYFAENERGAFKQVMEQTPMPLRVSSWTKNLPITMIISRRHGMASLQHFFKQFSSLNLIRCGSALKFCWVAEGFADLYPRFSPTCEWDTAAGQCILKEAGGTVIDYQGQILRYNTADSLRNSPFLAVGDKSHCWLAYLK